MTAFQLAFETRLIVRVVRADPNFDNVMSILKQRFVKTTMTSQMHGRAAERYQRLLLCFFSSKEDLAATCQATDASLLFYAAQRKNDVEAEKICRFLCDEVKVCDASKPDRNLQTALFFAGTLIIDALILNAFVMTTL